MSGGLSAYFDIVAAKRLTAVEVDPASSNQHEFNGVAALKPMLGTDDRRRVFYARHFDLDDPQGGFKVVRLTWYDARYDHPTRSEWRLYYGPELSPSLFLGGNLVVAMRDGQLYCFTAGDSTPGAEELMQLFPLDTWASSFASIGQDEMNSRELGLSERLVLAELGIAIQPDETLVPRFFEVFGNQFPSGVVLSQFVRDHTFGVDPLSDPDEALVAWSRVELELFNAMEARVETEAMEAASDLDEKLAVAMRIFQRRKSRAGKAFEHHLRAVFDAHGVSYSHTPVTEGREEPDFIFPNIEKYRDAQWPSRWLNMLAAKQTLRDRWRQVLNEAQRIDRKHLATLDQKLSASQVSEIDRAGVQLVIPFPLQGGYSTAISDRFMSIEQFVVMVKSIQTATDGWRPGLPR